LRELYDDIFPGTAASATTKTGRHDITEILLKLAFKHQKSINQTKLDLPCYNNGRKV
jgi:hypothetical protein